MEKSDYSVVLTKEQIKQARTYMPIDEKTALSKAIAELCIEEKPMASQNKASHKILSLPYLRMENLKLKQVQMMWILLTKYLKMEVASPFTEVEYDIYAGSHIMNQLERFKSDFELKNLIFDMMSDYKELEKLVNTEIYNIKCNNNDTVARFLATMEICSDPENIRNLFNILQQDATELVDKTKKAKSDLKKKKAVETES